MGPTVGWNSLLIEPFWPKFCSNGSRKGWIRLWPAGLNWHFGAKQIFSIFSVVSFHQVSNSTHYNKHNPNQYFLSSTKKQWTMHVTLIFISGNTAKTHRQEPKLFRLIFWENLIANLRVSMGLNWSYLDITCLFCTNIINTTNILPNTSNFSPNKIRT